MSFFCLCRLNQNNCVTKVWNTNLQNISHTIVKSRVFLIISFWTVLIISFWTVLIISFWTVWIISFWTVLKMKCDINSQNFKVTMAYFQEFPGKFLNVIKMSTKLQYLWNWVYDINKNLSVIFSLQTIYMKYWYNSYRLWKEHVTVFIMSRLAVLYLLILVPSTTGKFYSRYWILSYYLTHWFKYNRISFYKTPVYTKPTQ